MPKPLIIANARKEKWLPQNKNSFEASKQLIDGLLVTGMDRLVNTVGDRHSQLELGKQFKQLARTPQWTEPCKVRFIHSLNKHQLSTCSVSGSTGDMREATENKILPTPPPTGSHLGAWVPVKEVGNKHFMQCEKAPTGTQRAQWTSEC